MNLEELMASTPPMQQHALIKGFQAGAASRDAEIQRLQFALADSEALELGTAGHCDQLRAELASRESEVAELKQDAIDFHGQVNRLTEWNNNLASHRDELMVERDQLRAQINLLISAIKVVEIDSEEVLDFDECTAMCVPMDAYHGLVEAAEATPEQSLAEYRNKVIEECAKRAEAYAYMSQNFNALAEELRAMKEQP